MSVEADYTKFSAILEPLIGENLVLDKKYLSPIPRRGGKYEKTPSFKVFEGKGEYKDYLYFKDWGLTDQNGSRPVDLVMAIHNVDRESAIEMLDALDLPEIEGIKRSQKAVLTIWDGTKFSAKELAWWAQYHVSEPTLQKYHVRAVHTLRYGHNHILQNGIIKTRQGTFADKIAFSYRGGEDLQDWQFYCPDPKTFFRRGNFIYGWDQLPYLSDILIIVSGMKDGLVLHEATGLPFLAGSGEGCYKQFEKLLPTLKRRAKKIHTLLDPDPPGRMGTDAFSSIGIEPLNFKYIDNKKDIAKLSQKFGIEWLGKRIFSSLNL